MRVARRGDRRRHPARPQRERRPRRRRARRHGQRRPGVDRPPARVRGERDGHSWVALTHFHADHAGGAPRWVCRSPPMRPRRRERGRPPRAATPGSDSRSRLPRLACAARRRSGGAAARRPHARADAGHVAYWHAEARVAITGDLLQDGDVAWVPFGGPWAAGALDAGRVGASGSPRWTRCGDPGPRTGGDRRPGRGRRQAGALRALPRGPVARGLARGAPSPVSHLMIAPRTRRLRRAAVGAGCGGGARFAARRRGTRAVGPCRARRRGAGRRVFDTTVPHEPRVGRNHDTES